MYVSLMLLIFLVLCLLVFLTFLVIVMRYFSAVWSYVLPSKNLSVVTTDSFNMAGMEYIYFLYIWISGLQFQVWAWYSWLVRYFECVCFRWEELGKIDVSFTSSVVRGRLCFKWLGDFHSIEKGHQFLSG